MYKIYIIKNLINNKVYIGQTKQTLSNRWSKHKTSNGCPILFKAIQKYGFNNFSISEIERCNKETVNQREQYWIHYYKSTNSKFGYNILSGGQKHFSLSLELIEQRRNHFKKIAKVTPIILRNKITNTELFFRSIKDASIFLNCSPTRLFEALKKYHKSYKQYYIRKANELFQQPPLKTQKHSRSLIGIKNNEIIIYTTIKKAEKDGFHRTNLRRSILKQKIYKGFRWNYLDDALIQLWTKQNNNNSLPIDS